MKNRPGISWGPDKPINLREFNRRWYAIYYHSDGFSEMIKDFGPVQSFIPSETMKTKTGHLQMSFKDVQASNGKG